MFDSKSFLKSVSCATGVYRMFNHAKDVIYVGKAKNLRKRLTDYFRGQVSPKTQALVKDITAIEVTVTRNETEALILEANWIKKLQPRYNIALKDDKNFPMLVLTEQSIARLMIDRRKQADGHHVFGPFPDKLATRSNLKLLQQLFGLRVCTDAYFSARSRPCLLHQIKRCSAPCTGEISTADYQQSVQSARLFLNGKTEEVIEKFVAEMEAASQQQAYEKALAYRERIRAIRQVEAEQIVDRDLGDWDAAAAVSLQGAICVQLLWVRGGRLVGGHAYFPKNQLDEALPDILGAVLKNYYADQSALPQGVLVSHDWSDRKLLTKVMSERKKGFVLQVRCTDKQKEFLELAQKNAYEALKTRLSQESHWQQRWQALEEAFGRVLNTIECFDISHFSGESTVGVCVVFDKTGPQKKSYRRYTLDTKAADDYAAMKLAVRKRYTGVLAESMPDIIFIDGGVGQLNAALEGLSQSGLHAPPMLLAISKGAERKSGAETLWRSGEAEPWLLLPHSAAFHGIQQIRDAAHHFAITSNRKKIQHKRQHSILENIPGIGPERRRVLLSQFGGWQSLKQASLDQLAKVKGLSEALAQRVYDYLHSL